MPSREPELYKDKVEVSLDGRQIFYLFFGGAVIAGLVFVLGVMVGRRVEARGHLDRADTQAATDPLAALDRLERSDHLSYQGALTGSEPPTDVEMAIGALDRRDKRDRADRPGPAPERPAAVATPTNAAEATAVRPEGAPARPEARPEAEVRGEPRPDKHDGEKPTRKRDEGGSGEARPDRSESRRSGPRGEPVTRPEPRSEPRGAATGEAREATSDARPEGREGKPTAHAEGKRFTLQLSSFQDRSEAEAFLSAMKSAGFQPYLTEADVTGKGTFYRVRLGSYRSLEAANDAKAEYEKTARKTAQIMRL
jgi:cell division septation protein DedD